MPHASRTLGLDREQTALALRELVDALLAQATRENEGDECKEGKEEREGRGEY